jgi:hypothetical protein
MLLNVPPVLMAVVPVAEGSTVAVGVGVGAVGSLTAATTPLAAHPLRVTVAAIRAKIEAVIIPERDEYMVFLC